jgi:serine/threonine-protein kinase
MPLTALARLGPYEIIELIGAGGTGEVYRAIDPRLNRTVAIKLLKGLDIDRLGREAQAVAALNSPNICAIYDVGENYLVMEYVEGTAIKGPLPVKECIHLATQIASALEVAHSKGIIHRDLKPANILVTQGRVKLLDFGHAKHFSSDLADADPVTLAGTVLGTAAYMSPEQAQGHPVDPRADVFSFGLILYEMLSGRRAFSGETVLDVLNAIVHGEPRPLETTPELQAIVARCLRKEQADRFQSITEVKTALQQIPTQDLQKQPSIAVLPFSNLSADPDNEYFSDGLTEEIINELAHIPGLRVTARTSTFVFRKRDVDIRRIAETLNVQTLLEGSVRQSGTKIRVTAQLINAADGYHLWSKTYDREMAEVFLIQDDIATAIAKALQLRLYHNSTVSIPAYEAYLKARYYLWKVAPESLPQSRQCYEEAIALDPEFALAHCGYAEYYLVLTLLGMVPATEGMPAARANARRALDIDPALPEAHAVLGAVATLYDHDGHEAERRFELAVSREAASSSMVCILRGFYYFLGKGQVKEAVAELERALRDDPLNATLHHLLGVCLLEDDRCTEASREFHEALELDEHYLWAMVMLTAENWSRGMNTEARVWAERAYSLMYWHPMCTGLFAGMLTLVGESTQATKILEKLGDGESCDHSFGLTVFHLLVGELEKAGYWLAKVVQQNCVAGLFQLIHSPLGRSLMSSPQWPALAKTVNLPMTIATPPFSTGGGG